MTYRIVGTRAGFVALVTDARGLRRIFLPETDEARARRSVIRAFPRAREDAAVLPELAQDLERYFAGESVTFRAPLDWSGHGPFDVCVWRACARIAYGKTLSYKGLAEKVGKPLAARAVGMAMSRNPFPIVIPCHRVLKSDGSIGGYSGPGGIDFKRGLLEMERSAAAAR